MQSNVIQIIYVDMKSYTDIEQSKKLAEILPIESADMCYKAYGERQVAVCPYQLASLVGVLPCWSLAALLQIMPCCIKDIYWLTLGKLAGNSGWYICYEEIDIDQSQAYYIANSDLLDACYEMIIKLHERNLL